MNFKNKAVRNILKEALGFRTTWTYLNASENPVEPSGRLYVVVRNDLAPGIQISQSIHAKDEFTRRYPELEATWARDSNTIIILSGSNNDLYSVIGKALTKGVCYATFKEPQLNNEVTAVALEPSYSTVEVVRGLPLALRELVR